MLVVQIRLRTVATKGVQILFMRRPVVDGDVSTVRKHFWQLMSVLVSTSCNFSPPVHVVVRRGLMPSLFLH